MMVFLKGACLRTRVMELRLTLEEHQQKGGGSRTGSAAEV